MLVGFRIKKEKEVCGMKNWKTRIPGIVITVLAAIATVVFVVVLGMSRMLPTKYLILGTVAAVLVVAACALFTRSTKNKFQFTFGTVIAVLMTVVFAAGSFYLQATMNVLNDFSEVQVIETPVGVFVREDDPAQTIEDAKDYTFGVLSNMDTENTEKTLDELNTLLGQFVETQSYEGITQLADGLLLTEVDAIILNTAYLDLYEDLEGYTEFEFQIRELETIVLKEEVKVEKSDKKEKDEDPHVFSVYIGGSDSRGSINQQARNDVNIVATVNTETKQVLLVTTPRDYYVPLSISNGSRDKLTHAGIYGIEVSRDSVGMIYDTEIDYYFRINFSGVERVVDALGGITVNNDYAFSTYSGQYYPAGEVYLDSSNVLPYARDRKMSGGEEARGKRQLKVIEGCINKAMSPDILTKYTQLLDSVSDCIIMDVPSSEISNIVRQQLEDGGDWNITRYAVSGWGDSQQPWSMSQYAYVTWPYEDDIEKAKELMQAVRDGEIITEAMLTE